MDFYYPDKLEWCSTLREVHFKITRGPRKYHCRVSETYLRDRYGDGATPLDPVALAQEYLFAIEVDAGDSIARGWFESDGSVLL